MKKSILLAVAAAFALPAAWATESITVNPANAPTGTHLQSGALGCTVSNLVVRCSGYDLAGVGNTNATADLVATYTGSVICTNHGDNVAPGQTQPAMTKTTNPNIRSKNGKLTVPVLTSTSSLADIKALLLQNTTCPNESKWTRTVQEGSIVLTAYTYTLKFDGFDGSYIIISGP